MKSYKPRSIQDIGLEQYLESTKAQHNNKGFSDFKDMLERDILKTQMARMFDVSNQTMWKWVNIYQETN